MLFRSAGTKLFSYGIGSGINDNILGFPIRYSSINNVGDISFEVSLNSDTFTYVEGFNSITENINVGYVYSYPTRDVPVRQLGWQTAVSPSIQYQIFSFNYTVGFLPIFTCDIPTVSQDTTNWPVVQVYANNHHLLESEYTVTYNQSNTAFNQSNAAYNYANTLAFASNTANAWANTIANTYATFASNTANAWANTVANTKLANTSGVT